MRDQREGIARQSPPRCLGIGGGAWSVLLPRRRWSDQMKEDLDGLSRPAQKGRISKWHPAAIATQAWWCCNAALVFCVILSADASSPCAQDVEKVPPFELVALALTVLAAEKSCKDAAIDPDVLTR